MATVPLCGVVQPYGWGSRTVIADLLGRPPSGPEAELWLGAHPGGPSRLAEPPLDGAEPRDLRALIASEPAYHLGAATLRRYGELPFLLKVLAAERPLSIQTHPNAVQARVGFEAEERIGLAQSDPERIYKDAFHKPELIVALTAFEALAGFAPPAEARERLSRLGLADSSGPLSVAYQALRTHDSGAGISVAFRTIFELGEDDRRRAVRTAVAQLSHAPSSEPIARWFLRLAAERGDDPGVLALLLMRYASLEPGEGLYLPPCTVHAYLGGAGLEVMASSDNVLRAGLTDKHVSLPELFRVVDFEPSPALVVSPAVRDVGPRVTAASYETPAEEFRLTVVTADAGEYEVAGPAVALVLDGEFQESGTSQYYGRGGQFFVPHGGPARLFGTGRLVLARVRSSD